MKVILPTSFTIALLATSGCDLYTPEWLETLSTGDGGTPTVARIAAASEQAAITEIRGTSLARGNFAERSFAEEASSSASSDSTSNSASNNSSSGSSGSSSASGSASNESTKEAENTSEGNTETASANTGVGSLGEESSPGGGTMMMDAPGI